jgi:hypothetical protein
MQCKSLCGTKEARIHHLICGGSQAQIRVLQIHEIVTDYHFRFRYVALQITALQELNSEVLVWKALQNVPRGLGDTYLRILEAIPPDRKKQALVALTWLIYSVRPLSLSELAAASSIDPTRDPPIDQDRLSFSPDAILTILSSLVTTYEDETLQRTRDGKKQISVKLCHFSLQKFLTSDQILPTWAVPDHVTANSQLAESCLAFHLYASEVRDTNRDSVRKSIDDPLPFPMWKYAAEHWTTHFEGSPQPSVHLQDLALKALDPFSSPLFHMTRAHLLGAKVDYPGQPELLPLPLYLVASYGFRRLLSLLLSKPDIQVNAITGHYGTALNAATAYNRVPISKMLLEAGADPFLGNAEYSCALAVAVQHRNRDTSNSLLSLLGTSSLNVTQGHTFH